MHLINPPLSYNYNYLLNTGIFPDRLKITVVKPLSKRGNKTRMTNYRPVSLLTVFSNVLEKVVHSILSQHLHTINILVTEQCGFGDGISTEDAFRLTDSAFISINQKMHVGGIFCLWHRLLIVWIMNCCYLNYISVEFEEYLKIGLDTL